MADIFDIIINLSVQVADFFEVIINYLGQGFDVITAYISLPSQALLTLGSVFVYLPSYIVGPTVAVINLIIVLRVWKIITSGD